MTICLDRGADLHMAHSPSAASVKSRLVLPFWYRLTRVVPDKRPLNNGCVYFLLLVLHFPCRWANLEVGDPGSLNRPKPL